jgi:hypothetical protein
MKFPPEMVFQDGSKIYEDAEFIPSSKKNLKFPEVNSYGFPTFEIYYDVTSYIRIKPYKKQYDGSDFAKTDWLNDFVEKTCPPLPFNEPLIDCSSSLLNSYNMRKMIKNLPRTKSQDVIHRTAIISKFTSTVSKFSNVLKFRSILRNLNKDLKNSK